MVWEWDLGQWQKWKSAGLPIQSVAAGRYLFRGRLADKKDGAVVKPRQGYLGGDDSDQMEGGIQEKLAASAEAFNPLDYVQSPIAKGNPIPDLRIYNMFKKQIMVDFLLVRTVLILGNFLLIALDYAQREEASQVLISAIECILMAVLMMGLQWHVYKKWEEHKLPFKMKDSKANYLFKRLRYPGEL